MNKATLLGWERRSFAFSSVKDRAQSGRKKAREETCARVVASIESRIKSTHAFIPGSRLTIRDPLYSVGGPQTEAEEQDERGGRHAQPDQENRAIALEVPADQVQS
ncbi:hypothetical protein C0J52_10057 [Blattella germanica]|nr:hypothetical protein C0J52_10057 [Blattella germanica]